MARFKPPFECSYTFFADINGFRGVDFQVEEESPVEVHSHVMDRRTRYDVLPVCPEKPDRIELILQIIEVHIHRILFPVLK
jgi:hypothetical protein